MFLFGLILMFSIALVYALSTVLNPADNTTDDDGFLDLRATCVPTTATTATWYNITNATLYSNADGTWKANKSIFNVNSVENATAFFNFTNVINRTNEGDFVWNVLCQEHNYSQLNSQDNNSAFAGNNTIKVRYAKPTVTTDSPADRTYSLDGFNIPITCSATPSANWNITNISLMVNGTQNNTQVFNASLSATPDTIIANFSINKSVDGFRIIFGCLSFQIKNLTGVAGSPEALVISDDSSANRTVFVEFPPKVTLSKPADNAWNQSQRVVLSYTPSTTFDGGTLIDTRIWTNGSGEWLPRTGVIKVRNNTVWNQSYFFAEKTDIRWGIQAIQANDQNVFNFSINRTIKIDATDPTISVETENLTTSDTTPAIYATITEANLENLSTYTNFSGTWAINQTNSSVRGNLASGVRANYFNNTAIADGVYIYGFVITDLSGRIGSSDNFSLIIDTVAPVISDITNVSVIGKCDQRNITFTVNELVNYTFYYDTDTEVADGTIVSSSTKSLTHGAVLDFNANAEIINYFNISVTDAAGNTNTSGEIVGQTAYSTPASVCSGWSQYAVYDGLINLSDIENQTGADLVYFWNATNQEWVFKTRGLSSNGGVDVGRRTAYQVVHLFENTNDTWFRNTTNDGGYFYNVTSTNNFVSLPRLYNFGNLTESFMNSSKEFPSQLNNTHTGIQIFGPFNISSISGYNNSAQDYVNHIFNFTWSNATFLEPCPDRDFSVTCMETAWVASGFNVSLNATFVYSNWTI